jgi:electron transport complex protein RnfA
METATGMAMAVIFVLVLAGAMTWVVDTYVLKKFGLEYLRTLSFILVIASLVQFVEMFLKKSIPALYAGLGIFLPLITTNCAVMGVCLININEEYSFLQALVASFAYAAGFGLALILFAGVRERILLARVPRPLQDTSIGLITAGLLSLTFFAFKGWV